MVKQNKRTCWMLPLGKSQLVIIFANSQRNWKKVYLLMAMPEDVLLSSNAFKIEQEKVLISGFKNIKTIWFIATLNLLQRWGWKGWWS